MFIIIENRKRGKLAIIDRDLFIITSQENN